MLLIGTVPPGRHTEQHDVFFTIAPSIRDVIPAAKAFWPEGVKGMHFDAWREVTLVGDYRVTVVNQPGVSSEAKLFFINLGGYKRDEFEEFHYKMIVAAPEKGDAISQAKQTAFFRHTGFKGATSHVDDKYGVDVDDIYAIADILPTGLKQQYSLQLERVTGERPAEDEIHLGYFKLDNVDRWGADY